jgi:hypothetical protein
MNEATHMIQILLQPAAWPLLLVFIIVPTLAIFGHGYRVRMERAVFSEGIEIMATIVRVSVDEGDCNVRYRFVDPATGKEYFRHGVLGFQMKQPPAEGDEVAVKYLTHNPNWSRMIGEIHLSSSSLPR